MPPDAPRTVADKPETLPGWMSGPVLLVMIAVIGALGYAALHLATESFYGPFVVTPEDAGVDRVTLFVRSTVFVALTLALAVGTGVLGAAVIGRIRRRLGAEWTSESGRRTAVALAVLTLFAQALGLALAADRNSQHVREGEAGGWQVILGVSLAPYRATIADIHWRDGAATQLTHVTCGIVIGETSSYTLVYARDVGTFRVSPDAAIVVLHPQSDRHCP